MFNVDELELIGAIIGDGHIHKKHPKYYFGLTGNNQTDYAYFGKLAKLIESVWGKKAKVSVGGRGLRIRVYSRAIVERLTGQFLLPFNYGKCYIVSIPTCFTTNFSDAKHVLRGLVDTDGSVFVSDKPGFPNYPAIEITTVSERLAVQVREILLNADFRVTKLRSYFSKHSTVKAFKVCLYGKENLRKWIAKIGFSNPYKLNRAISAL